MKCANLNAPEGLNVGNIEDVKNTYRAGGTKQKAVRIVKITRILQNQLLVVNRKS